MLMDESNTGRIHVTAIPAIVTTEHLRNPIERQFNSNVAYIDRV